MKNDRVQALTILVQVFRNKVPLTYALTKENDVSPLTKAICFGVCRHYYRLQAIADSLMEKRPDAMEIGLVLLMGLYQLQYLNKPDYATVKETVDLLEGIKKTWAKGLVNAVMRRFCREKAVVLASVGQLPRFLYGHPNWFIKRVKTDWVNDWEAILIGNDCHPPMSLRINQRFTSRPEYLANLNAIGISAQAQDYSSVGITLDSPCDVALLPNFSEGYVSVQDEAAQLAVTLLDLKPGLRVLDACCAPGGKTCHILETEPALAECVALDIDELRLQRVRENLKRLHLTATVVQGDALNPESWWDGQLFDRLLLDAPCSATGVIRRHPDIKFLRSNEDIQAIVLLQAQLLQSLWPLLRPGGHLVYATCSVMKEENEQQIANFMRLNTDCCHLAGDLPWGKKTDQGQQLLPGQGNCDGFFYSLLYKNT